MRRVLVTIAVGLVVVTGCSDSSDDDPTTGPSPSSITTASYPVVVTATHTTLPSAPTNCETNPEIPACRPGHGEGD